MPDRDQTVYRADLSQPVDPSMTIPAMLRKRADEFPFDVVVEDRSSVGAMLPITASDLLDRVEVIARGFLAWGLEAGERVAILSPTSFDWLVLDLAVMTVGGVVVPIYESDSTAQIERILTDAHIRHVITATVQQADLVETVRPECVESIHSLDRGAMRNLARAAGRIVPDKVEERFCDVRGDSLATLVYTSGTTGTPKGVELTHHNFVGTTLGLGQVLPQYQYNENSRLLLFLPVAHVLARLVMHAFVAGRGRLAFSPNIKNLLPDIQAFKPSILLAVPRVLEKVYSAASAKAGKGTKLRIFQWSAKQSRLYARAERSETRTPLPLKVNHGIATALALRKIQAALGPNIELIISGGAPLAPELAEFFSGLDLTLIQGYGLTETTGPIAVQHADYTPFNTVGSVVPGNEIKISEHGEILVRGVSVSTGYHNLPDETAESFEDGWFHTGDLGTIDPHTGHLSITGRRKELLVTAGGKNVSPEVLEEQLQTHPLIGHVIVVGDNRPYIGALITLDSDMLANWLVAHNLPVVDPSVAMRMPEVQHSLQRAIDRANRAVSRAESIRRFRLVDTVFTVEDGYLTPSLKLRRSKVLKDYAQEVDALYEEGLAERNATVRARQPHARPASTVSRKLRSWLRR